MRRHHSQVRKPPRTRFFFGFATSPKTFAATPPGLLQRNGGGVSGLAGSAPGAVRSFFVEFRRASKTRASVQSQRRGPSSTICRTIRARHNRYDARRTLADRIADVLRAIDRRQAGGGLSSKRRSSWGLRHAARAGSLRRSILFRIDALNGQAVRRSFQNRDSVYGGVRARHGHE